jgi:hypothetical protein
MRGGKFEDERELYGTVGEGILAISYVQKDAFGRQRKHPVLWVITLADILNAHKTGIFQARRGMAHIGSELVLDVKLVTDENAEKFRVWLQKHAVRIRPDLDEDFEARATEFLKIKAVKK